MSEAKVFLTDYASYNEGTQFQFGHWVDLSDFSDEIELGDYITDHFEKCDKKSPLFGGCKREETMFTDYEGFPEEFYSESGMDFEKIYKFIELNDKLEDANWHDLHNQYCDNIQNHDSQIYDFDDYFFELFYNEKPMEAASAVHFGQVNWGDNYVTFNGYGNLETFNDIDDHIDKEEITNHIIENEHEYCL